MNSTKIILIVVAVLFTAWIAYGYFSVANIEKPQYTVIEKGDQWELREYEPIILAEVQVEGEMNERLNAGFRQVADYIFGNNQKQSGIAMTTPVLDRESEPIAMTTPVLDRENSGMSTIAFVMPSKYSINSLPKPNNARIKLTEIPQRQILVHQFSWFAPQSKIEKKKEILKNAAQQKNWNIDHFESAFYNPPVTPPFMRRNEVWAVIK